jgi:hypothetical protein
MVEEKLWKQNINSVLAMTYMAAALRGIGP